MTTSPNTSPTLEAARERAVFWHVRLASDAASESDWLAFEAWLAEDPAHQKAYEAVEQVWAELDSAPPSARSNLAALQPRPNRRTVLAGAVAASIAAAAVGAGLWSLQPRTMVFETPVGERRLVTLADGTRITMNGGSHLTATLGRRERRVAMADAEAVFDVAKDPHRPFLIEAGDREIRVVGTEFNVLHHGGRVAVAVRRGVVEVRPKGATGGPAAARLTKGQMLVHRRGEPDDQVAAVDPDAALAWTTGRLVFKNERLVDVAAAIDRYGSRPIVVSPEARDLKVTAVLEIGSEEAMLGSLAQFMPVQVEQRPDRIRLSLRR